MSVDVNYITRKKTIHVKLSEEEYKQFRASLFQHGVTMTAFFESTVSKFNAGDSAMIKVIDELKEEIKSEKLDRLRNINKDELYNLIEDNSPQS